MQTALFRTIKFIRPERLRQFMFTMTLMVLSSLLEVISIGSVIPLVSVLINGELPTFLTSFLIEINALEFDINETIFNNLKFVFSIFVAIILSSMVIKLAALHSITKLTNNIGFDLTNRVYLNVLRQKYSYHVNTNSSEILATLNKVQSLMGGVISPILNAVSSVLISVGITIFLFSLNWRAAIYTFGTLLILYLIISVVVRRTLQQNSVVISKAHNKRIKTVSEAIGNIRELILNRSHDIQYQAFLTTEHKLKSASIQNNFISAAPKVFLEGMGIIILLYTAYIFTGDNSEQSQTIPMIAAFAFALQKLLPSLQSLFNAWSRLAGNVKMIDDVSGYLALNDDRAGPTDQSPINTTKLELKDVSFEYAPGIPVLINLNAEFCEGEIVGIVGETGSGKSTLVDLVSLLITPSSGTIVADGKKINDTNSVEWQNKIAYVPQNPYFLDSTIINNITLSEEQTSIKKSHINLAIKIAQLAPLIEKLESGLATVIGERGGRLSGGQLQRIAIARAIYSNKPFLILDEATSALDQETEKNILEGIRSNLNKKTIVMITHRLSTLDHCDRIYKVDQHKLWRLK